MKAATETSPALLAAILTHIQHGLIVTDHKGTIVLVNPAAEALFKSCLGGQLSAQKNILIAVHTHHALYEIIASGLKSKKHLDETAKISSLDGGEWHINIVVEPLEEGCLLLLNDVSDNVFAERAKSDFVSLTAHQLKTPVAELKGYAENMLSGATGPLLDKQRYYLEQMKQVCDRNFHLIENLLDISQIEMGVITLNLTPIALHLLIEEALVEFNQEIKRKGLKLERKGFDKDVIVFADPVKTIEVLKNVLNNAIKFTDQGSVQIDIEKRGEWGIVKITDTGSGINDMQRETLFKRGGVFGTLFVSGHGAGLGLYIAKQFLTFQSGTIDALPSADKGTTMEIKLPKFTSKTPLSKKIKPIQVWLNPRKKKEG
jgi:PAS domain S-box-containing protein